MFNHQAIFFNPILASRRRFRLWVVSCLLFLAPGFMAAQVDFNWAVAETGTEATFAYDVEVDEVGNSYITGEFAGTLDLDPGPGVYNLVAGTSDIFFAKYDQGGNLLWANSIGSAGGDAGADLWIDDNGNVYLTGYFIAEMDADPGPGIYNLFAVDNNDAFIAKYNPDGILLWAFNIGSPNFERGRAITGDLAGNIYATVEIKGTCDFDPGSGTANFTNFGSGDSEIVLAKYSSAGDYLWASRVGGTGNEIPRDVEVSETGYVYMSGEFAGTADFDPSGGVSNLATSGSLDGFVGKYNAANGQLVWAIKMGGSSSDVTYNISLDTSSNVFAAGKFQTTADFDPNSGVTNLISAGNDDGFLAKYDSTGALIWANRLGNTSVDRVQGVHADPYGNVFISGRFRSTVDFDFTAGTSNLTALAGDDGFAAMYTTTGILQWAGDFRGTSSEEALTMASNNHGVFVTGGYFLGVLDFDPGADSMKLDGGVKGSGWLANFSVPGQDTGPPQMHCAVFSGADYFVVDDSGNCPIYLGDINTGTTDDCGLDSLWLSVTNFTCADLGNHVVTLYATDIFGKIDSCTTALRIADDIPPVASCFFFTAYLDSFGQAIVDPNLLNMGSHDNCGIDSMWTVPYQVTCADTGWVTVWLVVRDVYGNMDSCSAPVYVSDTIGTSRVKVSLPSDFQYCSLASQTLSGPGGYPVYLWSTGETTPDINVTGGGTYWLHVWNEYGCDSEDTVVVYPDRPRDELLDVPSSATLCNDDSLLIEAEDGYMTYQWSNGATTDFIFITSGGMFGITVTDTLGCIFYDSSHVSYYAVAGPSPVISPGGVIGLCDGSTRVLNAGAGYSSYVWNTGEVTDMISVSGAGLYSVQVTNGFGCVGYSDTVTVVNAVTPVVSFTFPGADTLFAQPGGVGFTYRWWVNAAFIPGAVDQWYKPVWSGTYKVEVTSPEGCVATKDTVLTIIGIDDPLSGLDMTLSPNPSRGELYLNWSHVPVSECEITLFNTLGQSLQTVRVAPGSTGAQMDLSSCSPGIYFVAFREGSATRTWKVIRAD